MHLLNLSKVMLVLLIYIPKVKQKKKKLYIKLKLKLKNKILHHLFYNTLTFFVGSFIMYRICVRLNPLNDYHVNKDMRYLRVIFGFVSILIRQLWLEISNHFSDNRPTMEDELIEYYLSDVQQWFDNHIKEEKKKRLSEFKFLRHNEKD